MQSSLCSRFFRCYFLNAGKIKSSALLLALAISFKPTALPILPVALVYLLGRSRRQAVVYSSAFMAGVALFCLAPIYGIGLGSHPNLSRLERPFYRGRRDVVVDFL